MKKLLIIGAVIGIQLMTTTSMASVASPKNVGKARLPFCTIVDKTGRTLSMHLTRGDWATGMISYFVELIFMDQTILRENVTIYGNDQGQMIKSNSLVLKTTILPKQASYESNFPARGELLVKSPAVLKYLNDSQVISCEYTDPLTSQN